jgi:GT2 family glycosyltransferase
MGSAIAQEWTMTEAQPTIDGNVLDRVPASRGAASGITPRTLTAGGPRPTVDGKFFFVGREKLLIKGVTYGPFAGRAPGDDGYDPVVAEHDFREMGRRGVNAVRLYDVPDRWLLDLAARHGLYVLVGLPWEQHVTFLDDPATARAIEQRVRDGVRSCAGHAAVLGYAVGNEIPARIVRWHGPHRVERFLERLCGVVREEDPDGLVTYVNYPSTEYLRVASIDFHAYNVYLEDPGQYEAYLSRLQNLAADRPLIMSEIGLDSRQHGEQAQAALITAEVRASFTRGAAGCFVFSWTDDWARGGLDITDWGFGLTTRGREPKRALDALGAAFQEVPFAASVRWPVASVVLCSFNGERTIADCLDGLARLDYPDYEVIVVDDGSTDRTAEIAAGYDVRLIRTTNQGLSAARNVGLRNARGDVVAYIDDDARPDRDWLRHLSWALLTSSHAGVGGPNIAPRDDGYVADLVALAPGGPIHVLRSDDEAEHIPGCNFAFRAESLRRVGGFDETYRVAGDDVDLCWRLQQHGMTLGFSPGAVVWHRRRGSVGAYLRQQRGYGRAEGLLERKWPGRYNALGHISWPGQLYGHGAHDALWTRARRYEGTWGSEDYQSLYQATSVLSWIPLMPEWFLLVVGVGLLGTLGVAWPPLLWALPAAAVGAAMSMLFAAAYALAAGRRARLGRRHRIRRIALLALLFLLQPIARLIGRAQRGLTPWRHRGPRQLALPVVRRRSRWSEEWHSMESRLREQEAAIQRTGAALGRGGPYDRWDLEARTGPFASARLLGTTEEHGAGRQQVRYRIWPRLSPVGPALAALFGVLAVAALGDQAISAAAVLGLIAVGIVIRIAWDVSTAQAAVLAGVDG